MNEGRFGMGEDSSSGNRERGEPRWEKRAAGMGNGSFRVGKGETGNGGQGGPKWEKGRPGMGTGK